MRWDEYMAAYPVDSDDDSDSTGTDWVHVFDVVNRRSERVYWAAVAAVEEVWEVAVIEQVRGEPTRTNSQAHARTRTHPQTEQGMPDELGGRESPIDLTDSSQIATHPITASQVGTHTGTNTQGREVRFSFQTPTHARQPRTRTFPSAGMRARAHTLAHPDRKGTAT